MGSEFRVNTYTIGNQQEVRIAANQNGEFIAVWQSSGQPGGSGNDIYAQRYNASGTPQGIEFRVNSTTTGEQTFPAIALNGNGDLVVVWESTSVALDQDIHGQRYNAAGQPVGSEFVVNTYTTSTQKRPALAIDSAGSFVVAYTSYGNPGGDRDDIYAQRFDPNGVKVGPEFRVNTYTTGDQGGAFDSHTAVGMDASGDFVIAYAGYTDSGYSYYLGTDVYARLYTSAGVPKPTPGNPAGNEFLVNQYTTGLQEDVGVAMDATGDFVLVWEAAGTVDPAAGGSGGTIGRAYEADGTPKGNEFHVGSTGAFTDPEVAIDANGDFMVVYEDTLYIAPDDSSYGVYARQYDAMGVAQTPVFLVNTYTTGSQQYSSIGSGLSGDFLIGWSSDLQDGSGYGVYAQRYNVPSSGGNTAPININLSNGTIPPGPAGIVVGTLQAVDLNAGDSFTYSLISGFGSTNNNRFTIVGNQLSTATAITAGTYSIRVRATDQDGLSTDKVFSINVTTINNAPTDLALTSTNISENAPANALVGTLVTTDPDPSNSFTYSLVSGTGSADNALFSIVGNQLVANQTFDFEAKNKYSVLVRTTDQGGLFFERSFFISVTDLPDPPTITDIADQVGPPGVAIGPLPFAIGDQDTPVASLTVSVTSSNLSVVPAANIVLGGSGAARTIGVTPIAFGSSTITVTVSDGSQTTIDTFVVSGDNPPTALALSKNSAPENQPANAVVGSFSTTDPDAGDTFTYTLVAGPGSADNGVFNISGSQLRTNAPLDFETRTSYSIRVRTTDAAGLFVEQQFTITVVNTPDPPTISTIANRGGTVGVPIGPISFTIGDQDSPLASLTVSASSSNTTVVPNANIVLGGSGANRTIQVTLAAAGSSTITITVSDGTLITTRTFQVMTVNVPPVLGGVAASVGYLENAVLLLAPNGTVSDTDSANFDTGRLTVSLTANATGTDRLSIRTQGTGAGQVAVSGNTVLFGGVAIGSFTGGVGTAPLVVTFSAAATPAVVQAVLRNVTYQSLSDNPTVLTRSVRFVVTDGDGGTSAAVNQTVNITPVNDPPVLGGIASSLTYLENAVLLLAPNGTVTDPDSPNFAGGKLTISLTANASANDRLVIREQGIAPGQIGLSGSLVLFGGLAIGDFTGGVGTTPLVITFYSSATVAIVRAVLRDVTFELLSENPTVLTRTVRYVLSDGDGGTSAAFTQSMTITPVNDVPLLSGIPTSANYTENATPRILAPTATVSDVDSPNFAAGMLTVSLTANGTTSDRLVIRTQGTGAGQVAVSGNTVLFGGVAIGTFTGGVGTAPLVVTFSASATSAAVQAVVRNVTYSSVSDSFLALTRGIKFILRDGDGGTSAASTQTVAIAQVNDVPVLSNIPTTVTFTENAAAILTAPNGTIVDLDSADFDTGTLSVTLTANASANDQLAIRNQGTGAGQVAASGGTVFFGGVPIGTVVGGGGTAPLVITFNASATKAAAQAVLRNITYLFTTDSPTVLTRTVSYVLSDGDGGTSAALLRTITIKSVNDLPVLGGIAASLQYPENATLVLAPNGTVADIDSANLGGGKLTVALTANATALDRLSIRSQGTGTGQVAASAGTVFYEAVAIGTMTGGGGTSPLVVTFNASSTPTSVQAVLRNIVFSSTDNNPTVLTRAVQYGLTDGDGGTAASVNQTVVIQPANDAPTLAGIPTSRTYQSGAVPLFLAPVGTVADVDSPNFSGGVLTVALTVNAASSDRLFVNSQGGGAGQISVSGTDIVYGGTMIIGSMTGGTGTSPLVITLTFRATVESVQALIRNITFANTSPSPPTATRTVRFTLSDGDGGTSANVLQTLNVV